jgi:hypothetical protein
MSRGRLARLEPLEERAMLSADEGWSLVGLAGLTPGPSRDSLVLWRDYDADGQTDLLVAGQGDHEQETVLYHNERGALADSGLALPGLTQVAATFADVNGDGRLDLFLAGRDTQGDPRSLLFLANATGRLTPSARALPGLVDAALHGQDFDNDGDVDLIISGRASDGARKAFVLRNESISARHEVAFIGAEVRDPAVLAAAFEADGVEAVQLSETGAVGQISGYLAANPHVDAIHLLVDGDDGYFRLGNTQVDRAWVSEHGDLLASWGESLAPDADILVYACNTAATADGKAMFQGLSARTGADVAASIDTTGGPQGDWVLEYVSGAIERIAVSVPDYRYELLAGGNCLNFTGTNNYVNCGNLTALNGASRFTVETWVYLESFDSFKAIFAKYADANNGIELQIAATHNSTNTALTVLARNGASTSGTTAGLPVFLQQWSHIAVVFDGTQTGNASRLKLYVNGIQQTLSFSGTVPATTSSNTAPFLLGGETTVAPNHFSGMMDDARIWTTARTQSQILYNMKSPVSPTESGLLAYYMFNQGVAGGSNPTATTLTDSTANALNGTLVNFALSGATSNWVSQ